MFKFFSQCISSARNEKMHNYSVEEIAKMMKPTEHVDQESLIEFACTVNDIFENKPCKPEEIRK